MEKKYIIDIKQDKENNDFVLDLSSVKKLKTLDLDINSCLISYKKALSKNNLEEASEILSVLRELTEYGDKRFSDANILFKIEEIILFYRNMNTKNIIDSMNVLLKIRYFFRFLNSQFTFQYDDENTPLIAEIKRIRDVIKITELVDENLYKNYNPSIKDLDIILEFKENFSTDEEYTYLEDMYNSFKKKINEQIKNLSIAVYTDGMEKCKNTFKDRYSNSFYESKEFKSLLSKSIVDNYKDFGILLDKYYLMYKYNNTNIYKEKEIILMDLLLYKFIKIPKIYRSFIIENIIKNKKKYVEISSFYDDANKNLQIVMEEKRLNSVVI